MFKLVEAYSGDDFTDGDGVVIFGSGPAARDTAEILNSNALTLGFRRKWQPRKVTPAPKVDWRSREQARIDSGEYKRIPDWFAEYCNPDHFVHFAHGRPGALAYTLDDERGNRDIQNRISPTGYLERFKPEIDAAERHEIDSRLVMEQYGASVKWAVTPKEIVATYTNYDEGVEGVNESCMRYNPGHWPSSQHPVQVYGDSDLRLAYMTNEEGATIARALVYEEKKVYTRVYGLSGLHDALKALGYRKSGGYYDESSAPSLNGARIRYVESKRITGHAVMPYLDEVSHAEYDGDKWFTLGRGETNVQTTNGITAIEDEDDKATCERCDSRVDEDDLNRVLVGYTVSGCANHEAWCEHCCDYHTTYSDQMGETLADNVDTVPACNEDDGVVTPQYAERHFHTCEHCDGWTSDTTPVRTCSEADSEPQAWGTACVEDSAFRAPDGQLYDRELAVPGTVTYPAIGSIANGEPVQASLNV